MPDIGTFEYAHNAPYVVCRGLHVFETEKRASARARGLSPGDTPQGTPLPRKPRLGCNQGGCIVCADCYQFHKYIENGECKGCLRRKVMLPALLRNDPNLGTLFIPHEECPQLHQINAINKEVNALKPLIKDTKDLSGRLAKEVVGQRLDCNGQRLDEYEDELYLEAVGVPPNAPGSASDSVLVDNREAEKARAEKEAGNALFQASQTHKEMVEIESELQNCQEQQAEPHNAATENACVDAIAEIETRKEGIATKLAEQQKKQASTFEKYYDLSKSESEKPYAQLSEDEQAGALEEFRKQQGAENIAPKPAKAARKAPARQQTPKQIKEAKYAEILEAVQKQQAKPDHVYVNETKTNTACKKRQAILDQQEMQWKSGRFDDVREKRDQWFHDATMQIKHRKFLESSLCENLAGHGIAADVFKGIYKQATDDAQAKMNAFQGECIVEGGEKRDRRGNRGRENRKRKYQQFHDKKYSKAYKDDDGNEMALSDCEDAEGGQLEVARQGEARNRSSSPSGSRRRKRAPPPNSAANWTRSKASSSRKAPATSSPQARRLPRHRPRPTRPRPASTELSMPKPPERPWYLLASGSCSVCGLRLWWWS